MSVARVYLLLIHWVSIQYFICTVHSELDCSLPPEQGPCEALFQRWFYNPARGRCEVFIYGGCEGNANNFMTKDDCMEACPGTSECEESADTGDCGKEKRRWTYNCTSDECERVTWGGCASDNIFKMRRTCEKRCERCPAFDCDLDCPSGFKVNRKGCLKCKCRRDKCDGVTCPFGQACEPLTGECGTPKCPANQVFNSCCHPESCDQNCENADELIPCMAICISRCCCSGDTPLLAADGVTCISRDQCA